MARPNQASSNHHSRRRIYSKTRREPRLIDGVLLGLFALTGGAWISDWLNRDETKFQTLFGSTHSSAAAYYARCDDARAAGAAPIRRGQPGYRSGLDADGDGIACEPYYGR